MIDAASLLRSGTSRTWRVGRLTFVAVLAGALSGCASGPPPDTFDLSAPTSAIHASPGKGLLAIAEPVAISPIDADRIVVRTGPDAIAYLKGAQWVDRLPVLVQSRLIETFENAHLLRSVGRPSQGLSSDNTLLLEIRRFEIDVAKQQAVIEMSAKIVDSQTGRITAARIFTASAPGSAGDGAQATIALNGVLATIMQQIVVWAAPLA